MKVNSKGKIFKAITSFLSAYVGFYCRVSMVVKCVKKRGGELTNRLAVFLLKKFCLFREGLNQTRKTVNSFQDKHIISCCCKNASLFRAKAIQFGCGRNNEKIKMLAFSSDTRRVTVYRGLITSQ